MSISREELYRHFGPKLIDALTRILKNEINILRQQAGLPERTDQQILDAIDQQLEQIPDYPWMTEPT